MPIYIRFDAEALHEALRPLQEGYGAKAGFIVGGSCRLTHGLELCATGMNGETLLFRVRRGTRDQQPVHNVDVSLFLGHGRSELITVICASGSDGGLGRYFDVEGLPVEGRDGSAGSVPAWVRQAFRPQPATGQAALENLVDSWPRVSW